MSDKALKIVPAPEARTTPEAKTDGAEFAGLSGIEQRLL